MPNIKLTLQYDGTRYLGWTRPAADGYAKTISYRISSVLQKMTGEDITLFAGAKTAPGVHALCLILSRLVDTFISRISLTMLPVPNPHNTVCVLSWEEARHWQSRSSGYSSS